MRAFLLLFLIFPVLELYVFFKVSTAIGFFPALLLIIAGSALGVLVVRVAGLATALRARESMQRGELPAEDMFQGLMLALGGGLLLLPGFISDVIGLIFLLPFTRRLIGRKMRARAEAQAMRQRAFGDDPFMTRPGSANGQPRQPNVIEGEYEHRDPRDPPNLRDPRDL
ncbi:MULTISPECIES: FxsA family protein [Pseudomonas]|uniref:FxsA family protein n=1 Tax=Pseudomonas sp. Hg7Tf TaxID=3236988 RepID=A0AB39I4Y0_9PSED|nr:MULTISPECIES: FxsA family protein [Pseudomonas]KJK07926.1 exclusion suppressor FxsA [Pseudomonas sp. 5]MDD1978367.1 membrane protein FxsA [Pseudomonas putida]MDH2561456.1 membrane protein FxsA [Pseudomonas sp. Hg5Tf]QYX47298.1 membrane protein FxsA [Pseudomonas sp. S11A 273]